MKKLYENNLTGNVLLVSGDGDYKKLVDYLLKQNRFLKILLPNKKFASSLYKRLGSEYYDYLDNISIQAKINEPPLETIFVRRPPDSLNI